MSSDQSINGSHNNQAGRDLTVINYGEFVSKHPSIVARVISTLSQVIDHDIVENGNLNRYEIDKKIQYNNVIRYKSVIDQYALYGSQIESVCASLDTDKPNSKLRLLKYIESEYLKAKGKYKGTESGIQSAFSDHSDDIIDDVHTAIVSVLDKAEGIDDIDIEDRKVILLILLSNSFIDCKLLEKPPYDNSQRH